MRGVHLIAGSFALNMLATALVGAAAIVDSAPIHSNKDIPDGAPNFKDHRNLVAAADVQTNGIIDVADRSLLPQ